MSIVSTTLIYLRNQENMTQEQAAKGLDMSRSTLASYETARREPNMDTLRKFADFYNVGISTFYDGPTEYYPMGDVMSTLGERIKAKRIIAGLSQTDLANAIGESKQTVYKYESGIIANIPLSKIEAISKVLRCPPSLLTGWEEKDNIIGFEISESLSKSNRMKSNTGERIKEARIRAGLTQTELADRIGVKFSAIHKYESGLVVNLKRETISAIANALNVKPSWLMCMDEEKLTEREFSESLSEDELLVLELFRKVPKVNRRVVINMIRAASSDQ